MQPYSQQPNTNKNTLHSTIHSLNLNQPNQNPSDPMPNRVSSLFADLGPHTLLPTRANSLALEETRTNLYGTNNPLHASLPPSQQNPVNNGTQDASFFSRQPWLPPQDLYLQWTWIEGNGLSLPMAKVPSHILKLQIQKVTPQQSCSTLIV